MFEDIEKMEQEIKDFRQNILASSQLVDGMSSIVKESQAQQALMRQVSTEYQSAIKSITEGTIQKIESLEASSITEMKAMIEACMTDAIQQISVANKAYIDELDNSNASVKLVHAELSKSQIAMQTVFEQTINRIEGLETENTKQIKSIVETALSEAEKRIYEANKPYIDELAKTDASMKALQTDLTEKYSQFSTQIENARTDELIKTCSDMRKSLELKTTLTIIGVIVVIVLEIVQIFVK